MAGWGSIRFGLLGPLHIAPAGTTVPIGSRKQRSLLAILLVNRNRPVTTDSLIDMLWEGESPRTAHSALQVHISNLRRAIGIQWISTTGQGYRLDVARGDVDVDLFLSLTLEGRRALAMGDGVLAVNVLEAAVGLWRGPALYDFSFDGWAQAEIRALEGQRLEARTDLLEARIGIGEYGVWSEIEGLIHQDPYRERLRSMHARALFFDGRQAAALHSLEETRRTFIEDLGVDLSSTLRSLERSILDQELLGIGVGGNCPMCSRPFSNTVPYFPEHLAGSDRPELSV